MKLVHPEKFQTLPRAILFDLDDTLYGYARPHEKAMAAVLEKTVRIMGIGRDGFEATFKEARHRTKSELGETAGAHSRLLYFQCMVELLIGRSDILLTMDLEQTYWRSFLSESRLFDEVKDLFLDLRGAGIRIAIVTDLTAHIQFRKLVHFGLDDCIDFIVTSEEAGVEKPHPIPFKMTLEKLQLPPQLCWMVGDNPVRDIEGGRHAGMVTIQKIHAGVTLAAGALAADAILHDFNALRRMVAARLTTSSTKETPGAPATLSMGIE